MKTKTKLILSLIFTNHNFTMKKIPSSFFVEFAIFGVSLAIVAILLIIITTLHAFNINQVGAFWVPEAKAFGDPITQEEHPELYERVEEARRLLPDHLGFPKFKYTEKVPGLPDFETGAYVPETQEIYLNSLADLKTVLHELGHHILDRNNPERCNSFISEYGRDEFLKNNWREDMADAFSLYVLGGNQFRKIAKRDRCIQKKYEIINEIFKNKEYKTDDFYHGTMYILNPANKIFTFPKTTQELRAYLNKMRDQERTKEEMRVIFDQFKIHNSLTSRLEQCKTELENICTGVIKCLFNWDW